MRSGSPKAPAGLLGKPNQNRNPFKDFGKINLQFDLGLEGHNATLQVHDAADLKRFTVFALVRSDKPPFTSLPAHPWRSRTPLSGPTSPRRSRGPLEWPVAPLSGPWPP